MNSREVVAVRCYECGRFVDLSVEHVYTMPPYMHNTLDPEDPPEPVVVHSECYKEPVPGLIEEEE